MENENTKLSSTLQRIEQGKEMQNFSIQDYNPIQQSSGTSTTRLKTILWQMINSTLFRWSPVHLGLFRKFRVALVRLFGGDVAWSCSLHPKAKIYAPWNLTMGELSSLGENCQCRSTCPIRIGKKTCIGADTYLLPGGHDVSSPSFRWRGKSIMIGDGCWVSTHATILAVDVGDFCVVGAHAVVVKSCEPFSILGGNPAKFLKKRVFVCEDAENKEMGND